MLWPANGPTAPGVMLRERLAEMSEFSTRKPPIAVSLSVSAY
jgi:hypothetical protein